MKSIHTPAIGVALACLASLPGAASAQSKVELFGVVDVGVAHLGGSGASKTGLSTGGANISRLGFRGTEDLGGGLKAGFWLEAGLDVDSGAGKATGGGLNFNRRSTVSLMGNWGEVRLGRDDSATFLN
ncbi:MAG: porin, partial [Comamonas sp.]